MHENVMSCVISRITLGEWISLDNLRLMCHESINEPEVRENYDYDLYIIA